MCECACCVSLGARESRCSRCQSVRGGKEHAISWHNAIDWVSAAGCQRFACVLHASVMKSHCCPNPSADCPPPTIRNAIFNLDKLFPHSPHATTTKATAPRLLPFNCHELGAISGRPCRSSAKQLSDGYVVYLKVNLILTTVLLRFIKSMLTMHS